MLPELQRICSRMIHQNAVTKCGRILSRAPARIGIPFHARLLCPHTRASYTTGNISKMREITKENAVAFLDQYDTVLLDCDGVLWQTDHITPIPGIGKTIQRLQDMGKHILYVTNNSMHCRNNYISKFREHGFDSLKNDIFCVAYAAAVYFKQVKDIKSKVYIVGSEGMQQELDEADIENFGVGKDPDPVYQTIDELLKMNFEDDVGAVLVGYDRYFDLTKLYKASSYLSYPDCAFVATNYLEKSVFISPNRLQPVTGAIVDAVISSSKRSPEVIGKPYFHLFECITAIHPNLDPARTVMIGDSLKADIGFAKMAGIDSVLALSGASTLRDLTVFSDLEPTYFLQNLNVLNVQ